MGLTNILIFILALIIMLIGLAGVFIPVLPGVPIIFAGAAIYGILTGFQKIGFELLLVFAAMTALALIIDYFSNYLAVKKMGGSNIGAIGAVLGLIIGIFLHWSVIIFLPFVLAVVFELIAGRKGSQALKAGTGAFIGIIFGGLFRFIIGCTMIGIFIWIVWF